MNFLFLEHPADLYLRAWGKDQSELFVHAAHGVMSRLAPLRHVGDPQKLQKKLIQHSVPSLEDLFVAWLNEILYQFSVHELYFFDARFDLLTDREAVAVLESWPLSAIKMHKGIEIKSATYHCLKVVQGPRWEAEVILDV